MATKQVTKTVDTDDDASDFTEPKPVLVRLRLTGKSPLMMHNERLANPLDPQTRALGALTSDRAGKKTLAGIEKIARMEWEIGMYFDEKQGPCVPIENIRKSFIEGARLSRYGQKLVLALSLDPESLAMRLEYDGPRTPAAMWATGKFDDKRTVVVGQSRVLRCRPVFREWSGTCSVVIDAARLDPAKFMSIAQTAGYYAGLGERRPSKGGMNGRYAVELAS